jgi:hypothetical protein
LTTRRQLVKINRNPMLAKLKQLCTQETPMVKFSMAMIKEINKVLYSTSSKKVTARTSNLSKEAINMLMKKAYERLGR